MKTLLKAIPVLAIAVAFMAPAASADCGSCGKEHKHAKHAHSIYETAKEAGFTTLVKAIDAAGLTETLSGEGNFTVFAPTDEAFAKLPKGTLESLLKDKKALKNVLLYHVVDGKVMAKDVVKIDEAKMLNGMMIAINTKDGVKIGAANVVKTDIKATNGIIHVIDTVLVPSADSEQASTQ